MNATFLITRPDHDDTTIYLYFWAGIIIKKAKKLGKKIIDLPKKKASYAEFVKAIKKINPVFLFLNGHGNEDAVTGYDNEILIQKDVNENVLRNRIAYALSCQSAKKLGPAALEKGARAYIGYDEDFIFFIDQKTSNPLSDKSAKLFLDPAIEVPLSLLSGSTPPEAYQKSQEYFSKNISRLRSTVATKEEKAAIIYLLWDMNHQLCLTG